MISSLSRRNLLSGTLGMLGVAAAFFAPPLAVRADPMAPPAASRGLALSGYDPVAYFTEGRAVPGMVGIALRWRGVRWHFASERNRARFEADPRAFAPQFGGYCTVALSEGRLVAADPENWIIHDGRLFLTETAMRKAELVAFPSRVVGQARRNWKKPDPDSD